MWSSDKVQKLLVKVNVVEAVVPGRIVGLCDTTCFWLPSEEELYYITQVDLW